MLIRMAPTQLSTPCKHVRGVSLNAIPVTGSNEKSPCEYEIKYQRAAKPNHVPKKLNENKAIT